jgi:hypothetical protein
MHVLVHYHHPRHHHDVFFHLKDGGRISHGKWAPMISLAILFRKVKRVLLRQIQIKLCILKLVLKQKYGEILLRSGTRFCCIPSNIILIHFTFFFMLTGFIYILFYRAKKGLQNGI